MKKITLLFALLLGAIVFVAADESLPETIFNYINDAGACMDKGISEAKNSGMQSAASDGESKTMQILEGAANVVTRLPGISYDCISDGEKDGDWSY